jgi:hypothetical protein
MLAVPSYNDHGCKIFCVRKKDLQQSWFEGTLCRVLALTSCCINNVFLMLPDRKEK